MQAFTHFRAACGSGHASSLSASAVVETNPAVANRIANLASVFMLNSPDSVIFPFSLAIRRPVLISVKPLALQAAAALDLEIAVDQSDR